MPDARALPTYCAFGGLAHPAAYRVESRWREAVTCADHLDKARRWAGPGTAVTPLPGHEPPPEQPALF
jgi:hypothetical protein